MTKNRCSPVSLALFIAIGAFLICTVSAQAGGPSAAAGASSNGVTAAVRSVQPALSGLFQVKSPRVWNNGVPAFLDTWDAFQSRTSSASLNKAYAFTTIDGLSHEVLYAGVERASSKGPVVFEFSQLEGKRSVGDLRIEAEIDAAGSIGTVRFESYGDGGKAGLNLRAILFGEGCNDTGTACIVSNGAVLEVGANLSQLLNGGSRFKGIQISTPPDSVVGTFTSVSDGCVGDVIGKKAVCTSNDVRLTAVVGTPTISEFCTAQFCSGGTNDGDACANNAACPGGFCDFDTTTFSATGRFTAGPQRYDVGIYIATDGDPNGDGARTGNCTRFFFEENAVDLDGDECGDINASSTQDVFFGDVTIKCVDNDNDGKLDIINCETWGNGADEIPSQGEDCDEVADVRAGTPSKCACGILPVCIAVSDGNACDTEVCRFTCSETSTVACDPNATNPCTTGTCTERVVHIPANNGDACGPDPDPDNPCDLPPTCQGGTCSGATFAGDDVECRASSCVTTDKLCCDVPENCTGTSAVCPTNGFKGSTVECRASSCGVALASCCDVPELCTGGSADCPADGYVLATTRKVCRTAENECDAAEECNGLGPTCPTDFCGPIQARPTPFCSLVP